MLTGSFAPFTAFGWTDSMDEGTDLCIRWISNRRVPQPGDGGFPDVPVLAISGPAIAVAP